MKTAERVLPPIPPTNQKDGIGIQPRQTALAALEVSLLAIRKPLAEFLEKCKGNVSDEFELPGCLFPQDDVDAAAGYLASLDAVPHAEKLRSQFAQWLRCMAQSAGWGIAWSNVLEGQAFQVAMQLPLAVPADEDDYRQRRRVFSIIAIGSASQVLETIDQIRAVFQTGPVQDRQSGRTKAILRAGQALPPDFETLLSNGVEFKEIDRVLDVLKSDRTAEQKLIELDRIDLKFGSQFNAVQLSGLIGCTPAAIRKLPWWRTNKYRREYEPDRE